MKREIMLTLAFGWIFCFRIAGETPPTDIVEAADHQRYSVSAYQAGFQEAWRDLHGNRLIIEEHQCLLGQRFLFVREFLVS
jgi:hypothetical protein